MSNTELINAYFDNELNVSEKKMFEDRLARDTNLQQEFKFQEDIIEGIRETRRQSLKARLDKIDVGGGSTGSTWSAGKITGLIGLVAVIGLGIYYFYPENEPVPVETQEVIALDEEQDAPVTEPSASNTMEAEEETQAVQPEQPATSDAQTTETNETSQPAVEIREEDKNPVVAPSFEDPENKDTNVIIPENEITGSAMVTTDNLAVAVNNSNKRYDFHYTLDGKQLMLYGDFQTELYQILEFNTPEMKSWFLSYGGSFYSLKETEGKVQSLEKVTDPALLKTLKEASKE
jgi:hypothetical protein